MAGVTQSCKKICKLKQLFSLPKRFQEEGTTLWLQSRQLYSKTGKWEESFTQETRTELEAYWKEKIISSPLDDRRDASKEKYYVLSMFPYPSGNLHMGHVRVYTISDTMARFYKMKGREVIHPMGWDAFGLPAENAAIDRGELPEKWTDSNIKSMKKQMKDMCFDFDWDREFSTCDPNYYRWTQYIFLKMFQEGLVYQKQGPVNWDPVDKTVLANEQIDDEGRSWRSGAVVERKFLKQWCIRLTAFSKALLDGLNDLDPYMWKEINKKQRAWIGKCEGCRFTFQLQKLDSSDILEDSISVYTNVPEGIYGVSHITLPEDHWICHHHGQKSYGDGVSRIQDIHAVHPITQKPIPLFIDTNVEPLESSYEVREEHLGVPSFNEEDRIFADKYGLDICELCGTDEDGATVLAESGEFSGMTREEAFHAVTAFARKNEFGGHITSARLTDWLISRQRYWGTPIPIIHCTNCKAVPVPLEDLPVKLPKVDSLSGRGASPLKEKQDWLNVKCPKCGSDAQRETDTMDTFVDSSWYFLRYTDPTNEDLPFSKEKADRFMPVDLYIGGIEHALLHLYYARAFQHFLYNQEMTSHREPFVHILTQGMVKGESYQVESSGKYIPPSQVDFSGNEPVEKTTGAKLIRQWEKMSKSKYNGVEPQDVLAEYGVDSTRLAMLSSTAPKADRKWSHEAHGVMSGVLKWKNRIWRLVTQYRAASEMNNHTTNEADIEKFRMHIFNARNDCLHKVNHNMSTTFLMNTVIARMHAYTSDLMKVPECHHIMPEYGQALCDLVIMLAPFAPLFASELWSGMSDLQHKPDSFNWNENVLQQQWPSLDPQFQLPLVVKVNHKRVFQMGVPWSDFPTLTLEEALEMAKNTTEFQKKYDASDIHTSKLRTKKDWSAVLGLRMKTSGDKASDEDSDQQEHSL